MALTGGRVLRGGPLFLVAGQALREEPLSQLALTAPLSGEPRALLVTIYVAGNLCLP